MEKYKVSVEYLKQKYDLKFLNFETTEEVPPLEGIIGQERAKRALEFGLKIKSKGYNIFVTGITGTGRTTSVEQAVKKIAEQGKTPDDWCYVYNFTNPDTPNILRFPPGKANEFKKDMEDLVNEIKIELPKKFESEIYEEHRNQIIKDFQNKRNQLLDQIEKSAKNAGFQIKQTPSGIVFIPLIEEQPIKDEDFEKLSDETKEEIRKKQEMLYEELNDVLRKIRDMEKEAKLKLNNLEKEIAEFTISPRIKELKEKYTDFKDVCKYLDDVEKDMIENIDDFKEKKEIELLPGLKLPDRESSLYRYTVNVLIDNSQTKGAPVVKETNPTAYNLCGRIEYRPHFGAMVTDFTMIKHGALHKANGGYLILQVLDLFKNYYAWETLKRALKNNEIVIEDLNEQFRLINTPTLRPKPIPLDLKVILIGHPIFYYLLYAYDEDFRKLFKVRADFSLTMDKDEEGYKNYASFISKICKEENLKHFDKFAVGKVIEYGSRIVEDRDKLTTRFLEIADLIREANFWADLDNSTIVKEKHIKKALEEKIYRSNLIEKRIEELIKEGTIMVDTDGEKVGQINGLSVISLGDYSFGKPSKITCNIYIGRGGIVNIDREVKLAGRIHNKGFLILNNYINEKYGQEQPISFSASICFEQLYEEIEGDSASSTEVYVLLSALSNIPIKQGIAVTGSVNQKGEIQPVGGINEKIEGFYYTCKAKGLTGKQGVIIPEKNLKHLVLNDEVIEAVEKGLFHIWAVKTIDEGIEILTGLPAGVKDKNGKYPEGTVNYLVSKRIKELTERYLEITKKRRKKEEK
ncbi:MAG: AAA family ATPase [Candidatus Omnitrophica bacterium]|nr:AAA family ATPase [Candidatus Omnitrophota bacterium]MCM8832393.1 AAA family ATPase [Candidatus Omnitrophota bacterium]